MEMVGDNDIKIFQAEASRLNFGNGGNGQGAMPASDLARYYLLLELTLALIPNVKELNLWVPYKHPEYQLHQLLKAPVTLNSVTHLSFTTTGDPIDLSGIINLLDKLPRLKRLEMNACGSAAQSLPLGDFALYNFHYNPRPVINNEQRECTWSQAQAILSSRKTTLKHLNIAFDRGNNFLAAPVAEDYLTSFHDFAGLETLWVRTTGFGTTGVEQEVPSFPADVNDLVAKLPASLTCIGFVGSHKDWDGIEKLAAAIEAGNFSNLKTVLVEQEEKQFDESYYILRAVGKDCEIIFEARTMEEYLRDTVEIFW
ncbi:hypothetical protein V8C42DRAFT_343361 [Trichoderma barbatum]